jgi:hypothetical protein
MGDIQDEIENKAEDVKDSSADQHLGDAMDDADPEAADQVTEDGELESAGGQQENRPDGTDQGDNSHALDDVDIEPPSA